VDLIVMGTHGRRGFDRLMVGFRDRNGSCERPRARLLAVHKAVTRLSQFRASRIPPHLSRILFCTDFSENSQRAF